MILTLIYVKDIVLLPHTYEYIRNLTRYRKDASKTIDVPIPIPIPKLIPIPVVPLRLVPVMSQYWSSQVIAFVFAFYCGVVVFNIIIKLSYPMLIGSKRGHRATDNCQSACKCL